LEKSEKYVKTRSSAQIRSHAQKYLIKLNKKYNSFDFGKNSNSKDNVIDNELIENFVKNLNYSKVDMDKVEKMILYIFKNSNGNYFSLTERVYDGIESMNFKDNSFSDKEIYNSKNKEKIFKICKIPKNKKYINQNESNQMNSLLGKKRYENKIDYTQMYKNTNGINNFGIEPMKMIQIENFINYCLDSNDPMDLTKLFLFFDTNFILNPLSYIAPNFIFPQQQNIERDIYNSMKTLFNESYNQSTDLSGKSNSDNSTIDYEKQKQINLNYQQNIINPNLEQLYPNILNGLFNNYNNFNFFQNPIQVNQFYGDNRFNYNG
jgi:hypothetical protein